MKKIKHNKPHKKKVLKLFNIISSLFTLRVVLFKNAFKIENYGNTI